jgi:hypothetical protein
MNDDMDSGELLYLIMKSNKVYLNGVLIKSKWDDTPNAYEALGDRWYENVVNYEFDADSFELELFT